MAFQWSEQQQAIFARVEKGDKSLNVLARAGTGKTTTGVEVAMRAKGRIFFGAFNKAIAEVIQERVAPNPRCTGGTFHSIGFKLLREIRQRAKLDNYKVSTLSRERYPYEKKVRELINDAVGFAKLDGLGLNGMPDYTDVDAWSDLLDVHDLTDEIPGGISYERVIGDCIWVFKKSLEMCESKTDTVIDFNDMLYAPLYLGAWKPARYDVVIVDEAQDTNETRLRLALEILAPGGIMVAIGDPAQSIYQFAGASIGAMDKIKERTHAEELPLSVTYRCPKKIVEMVNHHVPDYVAADGNCEGKISTIPHTELWRLATRLNPTTDVILCRVTRPLVGIARRLRSEGIPCIVEGNNGKSIVSLLTKWGVDMTWGSYVSRLDDYVSREAAKFEAKGKDEKAEYIREKRAILMDIADDPIPDTKLSDIVSRVERMFGQGSNGPDVLRLCTIHRAKGREWKKVVLVGRNRYMPSPWAKGEEQEQAEMNVEYVAITRTMEELVEVEVPLGKKKKRVNGETEEMEWWEL